MPLEGYFSLLRPSGTIVCKSLPTRIVRMAYLTCHLSVLGAPEDPMPPISIFTLIFTNIHITGSAIASPQVINEMLEIAAKHNVRPWIQKVSYRPRLSYD